MPSLWCGCLIPCISMAYVAFERENLVFDTQFLTLQIGDRVLIGQRTSILLVDGAIEFGVPYFERLDPILQRHALLLLDDDDGRS